MVPMGAAPDAGESGTIPEGTDASVSGPWAHRRRFAGFGARTVTVTADEGCVFTMLDFAGGRAHAAAGTAAATTMASKAQRAFTCAP